MANKCPNQGGPDKVLPNPGLCTSQRSLRYTDMHSNYKGPFINRSYSFIKSSEVKTTPKHVLNALSDKTQLPDNWSWRYEGVNRIEDGHRNQGQCGSCWAVSLVSALGDRYAIKYNIAAPYPSAMLMISCGGPKMGYAAANQQCLCGGSPFEASKWLETNSIGMESCWPYSTVSDKPWFPPSEQPDKNTMYVAPICPITESNSNCCFDCCGYTNGISNVKFNVEAGSTKSPLLITLSSDNNTADAEATINLIKHDIYRNGPIATTFFVPNDFMEWWMTHKDNDIYTPTAPNLKEGHGVVLTGWGIENDQNFWEMRNSWGNLPATHTTPAISDYCRFRMSTDINPNLRTGIDIPIYMSDQGGWAGGTISFLPGELSEYNWTPATGENGGHRGHTGGNGGNGGNGGHTGGHTGGNDRTHKGHKHHTDGDQNVKSNNIYWIIGIVLFCILIAILLILLVRSLFS